jgi:hypothetical protein
VTGKWPSFRQNNTALIMHNKRISIYIHDALGTAASAVRNLADHQDQALQTASSRPAAHLLFSSSFWQGVFRAQ